AVLREPRRDLQQQGRLPGARRTPDEGEAARNDAAAQDGVELAHAGTKPNQPLAVDVLKRNGSRRRRALRLGAGAACRSDGTRPLLEAVLSVPLRTAAGLAGAFEPADRAEVNRTAIGHDARFPHEGPTYPGC